MPYLLVTCGTPPLPPGGLLLSVNTLYDFPFWVSLVAGAVVLWFDTCWLASRQASGLFEGGKSVTYILKIHNEMCEIHQMTSQTERYQ